MTFTPRLGDPIDGIASRESEDFAAAQLNIISGSTPEILPTGEPIQVGQTMAIHTVVGFDAGELVPAVLGTVQPIGVLMTEVENSVAGESAVVWRAGCFDPTLLVWDASYATLAQQRVAFEGSPSPTQVIMRPRQELDLS